VCHHLKSIHSVSSFSYIIVKTEKELFLFLCESLDFGTCKRLKSPHIIRPLHMKLEYCKVIWNQWILIYKLDCYKYINKCWYIIHIIWLYYDIWYIILMYVYISRWKDPPTPPLGVLSHEFWCWWYCWF